MRKSALAVLLACTLLAASSSTSSAEALELSQLDKRVPGVTQPVILASLNTTPVDFTPAPEPPKVPEVIKYKVVDNDSLSTIAKQHDTTWKRLFDKNEAIANPDVIKVGDELIIPRQDEQLKERPLPEPIPEPAAAKPVVASVAAKPAVRAAARPVAKPAVRAAVSARGSSSGNTYTAGYCTWYVKNKKPSLPNNLGNADTWVSRARAQGMATGSTPRAGAAGQRGMHVVYVESVNADGSVNISEMNHKGLYVVTRRTLPGSYFQYIY